MTPQEFGALIRSRREEKGLGVEEIAARIKLSPRALRSMEEGTFDGLPHAVYARGFVRSYALSAGLSEEETEQGLAALFPTSLLDETNPQPGPIDRQRNSKDKGGLERLVALLTVFVLLALPLAGGWFVVTHYGDAIMNLAKRTFSAAQPGAKLESSAPSVNASVPSLASSAQSAALERDQRATPQTLPVTAAGNASAPAAANATVPVAAPQRNATVPEAPPAAALAAVPSGENSVVVEARSACWVKATADGAEARTVTVKAGETSIFPFKKTLSLTLGNVAGVKLHYNGKPFSLGAASGGNVKTYTFPPRP